MAATATYPNQSITMAYSTPYDVERAAQFIAHLAEAGLNFDVQVASGTHWVEIIINPKGIPA